MENTQKNDCLFTHPALLIGHERQRFENQGKAHGKHAGQAHAARESGQEHRRILPPHGPVALMEVVATEQGAGYFQNNAVGG